MIPWLGLLKIRHGEIRAWRVLLAHGLRNHRYPPPPLPLCVTPLQQQNLYCYCLQDSDDRAVGYVAGSSPNRWGMMRDGSSILDLFPKDAGAAQQQRRAHKLFAPVVLLMLKEVHYCDVCYDTNSFLFVSGCYPSHAQKGTTAMRATSALFVFVCVRYVYCKPIVCVKR